MFIVQTDKRVEKILHNFSKKERARIDKIVELFSDHGFRLNEVYLKKLNNQIWELRPGNIRLLFGVVDREAIIVHVFLKKTMKTPRREIELAQRRLVEYL